jgi:hypothetical protein
MRAHIVRPTQPAWLWDRPNRQWNDKIAQGWIPVDIAGPYLTVRWMQVGCDLLSEPFFGVSVSSLRASSVPREFETDLTDLARQTRHLAPIAPAGFIFHISRCGSTLVSNALRTAEDVVGLSEAGPIERIMQLAVSLSSYNARLGRASLAPLTSVYAHYLGQPAKKVIIKCCTGRIEALRAIRSVWPNVPCLILIRNPLEVVVSNQKSPPAWLRDFLSLADCPFGPPPHEVLAGGPAELCAWVLGQFCNSALTNMDSRCRVIDYAELTPVAIRSVGEYFGLKFSSVGERAFREMFGTHAKNRNLPFQSDVDEKRHCACDSDKRSIDRWASLPYEELRKRQFGSLSSSPLESVDRCL